MEFTKRTGSFSLVEAFARFISPRGYCVTRQNYAFALEMHTLFSFFLTGNRGKGVVSGNVVSPSLLLFFFLRICLGYIVFRPEKKIFLECISGFDLNKIKNNYFLLILICPSCCCEFNFFIKFLISVSNEFVRLFVLEKVMFESSLFRRDDLFS